MNKKIFTALTLMLVSSTAYAEVLPISAPSVSYDFFSGISTENRNMNLDYSTKTTINATQDTIETEKNAQSSSMSPVFFAGVEQKRTQDNGDVFSLQAKTELGKSTNIITETLKQDITFNYMGFQTSQEITTDVTIQTDIYLTQSFQFGLTKKNWNGWKGYGSIGGSFGRYNVNMSDSLGMDAQSHGDMFIGEIGIGIEKDFNNELSMFAEYNYGQVMSEFSTQFGNDDYFTEAQGKISYDRIQFGFKYNF